VFKTVPHLEFYCERNRLRYDLGLPAGPKKGFDFFYLFASERELLDCSTDGILARKIGGLFF
jgi:hypothetical protein